MKKGIVRLTEADLHKMIMESAKDVLKEMGRFDSDLEEGESFKNNQGYSHFAVNKATNKIVNGWDYSEYDPSELRQFKKDYFDVDMADYGFNPRDYKIVTGKYLLRQGIDPNDNNNWANNDETNADWIG